MPIGTTSYLFLLMALKTDAAESRETSCSPLRPPNRMPTRSFFMTFQCGGRLDTSQQCPETKGGAAPHRLPWNRTRNFRAASIADQRYILIKEGLFDHLV